MWSSINRTLNLEKPDLVVFTGDNVTDAPAKESMDVLYSLCAVRNIAFAVIMENHDAAKTATKALTDVKSWRIQQSSLAR